MIWIQVEPRNQGGRLILLNPDRLRATCACLNCRKFRGAFTMVRYLVALSIATLTMFAPATAAEFGSKEEAIAMVKRVQEQFKKDGPELTFKAVSDKQTKEYHDRDLYPFIYFRDGDKKGLCVA